MEPQAAFTASHLSAAHSRGPHLNLRDLALRLTSNGSAATRSCVAGASLGCCVLAGVGGCPGGCLCAGRPAGTQADV